MAPVWGVLRRRLIVILVAVIVTMLVAWGASQSVVRPLNELTERVDRMAAGGYTGRVDINRADELGRLAKAFDEAGERVRGEQQRLENRVRERTAELHDTLEQLRGAQEQLVRKERLAILGQLSSGVGHELRNPLGVMTNAVYYLDAVAGNSSPKVKEYLGILRTQIALSERIVSDLLDFARVKQPQRQVVSLRDLTDQQLARLGDLNGVKVQHEFPADLPPAFIDPMQMGQVVLNLLTNAVQAMGSHGGALVLRGATDGDRLRLEVQDSGPGIEPALIEQIFEPLYTTKARGIGLGLAVSRTLAANNDAQLTVVSTPGHGATFVLTFPQARAGVAA
jgi:signal transduction histidine kinase